MKLQQGWINALRGLGCVFIGSSALLGCSEIHRGVYSYEEVYVANKGNDFEFSHFKFFGSDNVIIVSETENPEKDFSGLCRIHKMNCNRVVVSIGSEKNLLQQQLDQVWQKMESFKGESFLLISDSSNSAAAVVSKYAKNKYNENSKNIEKIIKNLKADEPEAIALAIGND